jgi:hypothetical protein
MAAALDPSQGPSVRAGAFLLDGMSAAADPGYVDRVLSCVDLLYHCSSLNTLVLKTDGAAAADMQGNEQERAVFAELRRVFVAMNNAAPAERITIQPFIEKLSSYASASSDSNERTQTIQGTWDDIVSVILAVNPQPLWEIFMGRSSSPSPSPRTSFLHCYKALFYDAKCTLEDMIRSSHSQKPQPNHEKAFLTNAVTLKRTPLLLVVACECIGNSGSTVRFSETLDVSEDNLHYDLVGVAMSDEASSSVLTYFRPEAGAQWLRGSRSPACGKLHT